MNNTTEYSDDVRSVLLAGIYINNYYLWVIFAFGFPGNLASVVTILRMQRVTTSTFYVATLAVVDNFAIILKLIYNQVTLNEIWLGSTGCKLLNFFVIISPTCANWILVFIATERFIAVRTPLKIGMFWTIPRAVISIVCLVGVIVVFYSHILWTFTGTALNCFVSQEFVSFYSVAWYWMNSAVYSFIPCVLLATFNYFIISSVRKSYNVRKKLSVKKKGQIKCHSKMKQEAQITLMLVSVAVVFIILTVPRCIYVILHPYWIVAFGTMEDAQKYMLDQITYFLCDSNHAINFYLYFIIGKNFRRHFLDMILCRKGTSLLVSTSQGGNSVTLHTKYMSASTDPRIMEDEI